MMIFKKLVHRIFFFFLSPKMVFKRPLAASSTGFWVAVLSLATTSLVGVRPPNKLPNTSVPFALNCL